MKWEQIIQRDVIDVKASWFVGKDTAKGVKAGAEEVNKWFKGIGEGIEDLGRKL